MKFAWRLSIYEPSPRLFSSARYDMAQTASKVVASIDKVHVNDGEAKLKRGPMTQSSVCGSGNLFDD